MFYAVSLEFLGFIAATTITITFILRFAERYPWGATLALTAGTIIGCQVLFVLSARRHAANRNAVDGCVAVIVAAKTCSLSMHASGAEAPHS